ncbi:MAG: acyl carrier protein [Clostridia bacterium]|nr:acyl carrier protein [Clostridia bacterium]MBQ2738200.1 acyl carrier protein [Clostridia bacterium]MBQ8289588.1 acyl carrier protein [Clostridia bacterium]
MLEKLKSLLERVEGGLDVSEVNETTRLVDDLGLDSLSIMLFAMEIESEFGIRFDGPVTFNTVGDVCEYLEKRV